MSPNNPRIIISTFTFRRGEWDDEFYALDNLIAQAARSIPGYLGEESWENTSMGLISNVYYWESMQALQILMSHPAHLEAKSKQARWLNGYQVLISELTAVYGDGKINHHLAGNARLRG